MKKLSFLSIVLVVFFIACKSSKMNSTTEESKPATSNYEQLNGTWQLIYISGPRIAFQGLYPDRKPVIRFTTAESSFGGNTSCNSFSGKLVADHKKISFTDHMALTKMYCPGEGEQVFLKVLQTVNAYAVQNDTLTFTTDEVPMMRFVKQP